MKVLRAEGLHYVDVGTSGGVWGLERTFAEKVRSAMREKFGGHIERPAGALPGPRTLVTADPRRWCKREGRGAGFESR
ncbi:MAG: hypothetical protein HYY95_16025 [Candidatus Rokubacteria bacterium]|nr:hypothetical protein [Candidatus Rokubacteria bacterium]MBI3107048.1 hypothetical protein [Candidatus Rokubacteria bacterium]